MSRGCRGANRNRVAVPVPGVEPLRAGGGGVCARRVSARVRRWEGAGRREGGEAQPALPAGVAPVRLPDPVLQLRAVLCRRGGPGRFNGEVSAGVAPGGGRHVWRGARASLPRWAALQLPRWCPACFRLLCGTALA